MQLNIGLCLFALLIGAALAANVAIPKSGPSCTATATLPIKAFKGLKKYPWMVEVFGIKVVATNKGKAKVQHVASILAELLDNDNDGCVDDPNVYKNIKAGGTLGDGKMLEYVIFVEFPSGKKLYGDNWVTEIAKSGYMAGQQIEYDEIVPKCSKAKRFTADCVDATQEELVHFITTAHTKVYPKIFGVGWDANSDLNKAMDKARGGKLKKIPTTLAEYPKSAWYRYVDITCDYECQPIEYIWWGYCSYSGLGKGLGDSSYKKEYKYYKKADFIKNDKGLAKLFQDSEKKTATYRLPTNAADGLYTGCKKCPQKNGKNYGGA